MKVRIVSKDTCTGEEETRDVELSAFSGEAVNDFFNEWAMDQGADRYVYELQSWTLDAYSTTAVFVLKNTEQGIYCGYLLYGVVYTTFR